MARTAWALLGVAVFVGVVAVKKAEAHQDDFGSIVVTHPYVQPAQAGNETIARLRIENQGSSTTQFLGMHMDAATDSAIEIKVSPARAVPIGSMAIRAGETLDLEENAWIRFTGLRRDLVFGETLEACLDFADGREMRVIVTVGRFEI